MKNKPHILKPNDTIALVCPAFKSSDMTSTYRAKDYLEKRGYKVVLGESCSASEGYLAGSDELRTKELESMFLDKNINAIICMRGGYGASRIVDKIDYDIIKNNPKIFSGYSDITVLLNSIYRKAHVPTLHGMVGFAFGTEKFTKESEEQFWDFLTTKQKGKVIHSGAAKTLIEGKVTAEIVGGNLSLLATMISSSYSADFKDKIVFIEEVEEEPYQLDRYFSALRLSHKLDEAKGFIFGYFTDCVPNESRVGTQTYLDLIKEYFMPLNKPIIYDFPCGHSYPFISLPIGTLVEFDASKKEIKLLEEFYQE